MATEIKISNTKFTVDGKHMVYDDLSTYTDPLRSAVAVLWYGVYKAIAGDVEMEFAEYDPLTATKFFPKIYKDGWHRMTIGVFEAYSSPDPEDFTDGDVVYDSSELELVRLVEGVWSPILIKDAMQYALDTHEINEFPVVNNTKRLNDLQKFSMDDLFTINMDDSCAKSGTEINTNKYNLLYLRIETILGEKCAGNWKIAQRNVEFLNKRLP